MFPPFLQRWHGGLLIKLTISFVIFLGDSLNFLLPVTCVFGFCWTSAGSPQLFSVKDDKSKSTLFLIPYVFLYLQFFASKSEPIQKFVPDREKSCKSCCLTVSLLCGNFFLTYFPPLWLTSGPSTKLAYTPFPTLDWAGKRIKSYANMSPCKALLLLSLLTQVLRFAYMKGNMLHLNEFSLSC